MGKFRLLALSPRNVLQPTCNSSWPKRAPVDKSLTASEPKETIDSVRLARRRHHTQILVSMFWHIEQTTTLDSVVRFQVVAGLPADHPSTPELHTAH